MVIIPVVIGSILQCSYCNFYFKRTALKIVTVTSSIVKRMALNNSFISFLVEKNLIVKRTFSFSISEINLVPFISVPIYVVLMKQQYRRTYLKIITELSLMILIASFDHSNFARELTYLAIVLNSTICVIYSIWNGYYVSIMMSIIAFFILIFCFSLLHGHISHETAYIAVALSIAIFTYDLVNSFVKVPYFVAVLLFEQLLGIPSAYLLIYSLFHFVIRPIRSLCKCVLYR